MNYDRELAFTKELLHNMGLQFRYIHTDSDPDDSAEHTLGLADILNYRKDERLAIGSLIKYCHPNVIYQIHTPLMSDFLFFQLPDEDPVIYAYIGPYTRKNITKQDIYKLAERYRVAPGNLKQIEHFYQNLPLLADESALMAVVYTLGAHLWGSADNFSFEKTEDFFTGEPNPILPIPDIVSPEEALLSIQLLEERYDMEHQFKQAVSTGQTHKAELYFSKYSYQQFEQRANTPLRNLKNYAIILNTILRTAAEAGTVHPIHLDSISSQYAKKIELVPSETALHALMKEMVRKYCLLVKNHSLKGYSLLVRKIITHIEADLTADLSLKTQAELLNVNSSYLSTLFKKETGLTLTEFVNRKRIERAILLLNSTNMQIQMIAQYCGIPDVNYFTKTFKKIVGITPKQYRDMISIKA